jgi:heparin binding hemagglutinin HbhA
MTQPTTQKEQDMAMAKFDIKTVQTEATKSAQRAFNAGVGVTDLAVGAVRDYAAEAQKLLAAAQQSVVTFDPNVSRVAIEKRVSDLRAEAFAVPGRVQRSLDLGAATATDAYGDLVKRGQTLVGRIRRQQSTQDTVAAAQTTVTKAKTTKTQATGAANATKKTAAKKRTAAKSSAKATGTAAKTTTSSASRALNDAAKKVGD